MKAIYFDMIFYFARILLRLFCLHSLFVENKSLIVVLINEKALYAATISCKVKIIVIEN